MSPSASAPEPRWPAVLAILASAIVFAAIPGDLAVGPRWVVLTLVGGLEIPSIIAHRRQWFRINHVLGLVVSSVLTLFLLWSLALLLLALPQHKEAPVPLLSSAACLWIANIIVFALWYWRLDAGGPTSRRRTPGHNEGAFLFPQMMYPQPRGKWWPRFIDYLFLAFNTSTAFSPTDVPILAGWAKLLMMLQSLISLMIVIILAARAVNIL